MASNAQHAPSQSSPSLPCTQSHDPSSQPQSDEQLPREPEPARRTSVSFDEGNLQRTSSRKTGGSKQRVDGIMQGARNRAENMRAEAGVSSPVETQTPGPTESSPAIRSRSTREPSHSDLSSADELTGMFMRGPDRNYNSISDNSHNNGKDTTAQYQQQPPPQAGGLGARSRRTGSRRTNQQTDSSQTSTIADGVTDGYNDPRGRRGRRRKGRNNSETNRPWHRGFLAHFQSIELENKGSVARDHLALERTFLAWLRTSLAFASIGIAVTQLFRLNTSLSENGEGGGQDDATLRRLGKPLGATFLAISIVILFLGYHRYFNAQRWIIDGKFPASRGTIIAVAFVAFAVMMASLVVVIVVHPRDSEL